MAYQSEDVKYVEDDYWVAGYAEEATNVIAFPEGTERYLPNGYIATNYFQNILQTVSVVAPVAEAREGVRAYVQANESYADVNYVIEDYFDDALEIISVSSPIGVFRQSVTIAVTDLAAVVATVFGTSVSTDALIQIGDLPQVNVSSPIAGFEGDVNPSVAIPEVTLTAAEASATGQAEATFGALLVVATAPIATAGVVANRLTKVVTGENYIQSGFHAAGYFKEESATVTTASPTANLVSTVFAQVDFPEVTVSAPANQVLSNASVSVSYPSITISPPDVNEVIDEFPLALPQVVISAPAVSTTGGTGVTASPLGAILYVEEDYVDAGYTDDPIQVTVISATGTARLPAGISVTSNTINVSSPEASATVSVTILPSSLIPISVISPQPFEIVGEFPLALNAVIVSSPVIEASGNGSQQVTSNTISVSSPTASATGTATVSVDVPQITVSAPQVAETVVEFPESLPQITVSSPQATATGTANVDVIFPEVRITSAASTATGTANVSVSAETIQAQPPQVFETVREFPRTLPAIQVIAPAVVGTGTANVSVDHASVTVIPPTSLGDTGGDAVSSPNFLIAVSSPQATATNNSTIAVNNASVTISSPVVEAVGLTLTNALVEVSIGTVTVSSPAGTASTFVTDPERTIIVESESRNVIVASENRTIVVT